MGSVKRAVRLLESANGQLEVIEVETATASEAVAALHAEFVQSGDADAVTAKLAKVRQRVGELSNDIEEAAENASKARRILNSVVSPTSTQVDPALAAALQEAFAMLEEVEARIEEAREGIAAVVQAIQDLQKAMN
jgi:DNA repair exonuclease SbcCD ATPase subunit